MRFCRVAPGCQNLIMILRQCRQPLQKRHHTPDTLVIVSWSPSGHARCFNTVLDNPELALDRSIILILIHPAATTMFMPMIISCSG